VVYIFKPILTYNIERVRILSEEDIIVDESLISTDVDQLIKLISGKGKMRLSELEKQSDIDKKNVEKWVRVLEDEGYITIEYGITGTYVVWAGTPDPAEDLGSAEENLGAESTEAEPVSVDEYEDYSEQNLEKNRQWNQAEDDGFGNEPAENPTEDETMNVAPNSSSTDVEPEDTKEAAPDIEIDANANSSDAKDNEGELPEDEISTEELEDKISSEELGDDDLAYPVGEGSSQEEEIVDEGSFDEEHVDPDDPEMLSVNDDAETEEEPDPESLLDEYLSRKKTIEKDDNSNLKKNILGNLDDDIENSNQVARDTAESYDVPSEDESGGSITEKLPEYSIEDGPMETSHDIHDEIGDDAELPSFGKNEYVKRPSRLTGNSDSSMRELIDAYMKSIREEKEEIAALRKEREKLYTDKLTSLEGKMEGDLATLTEHVLKRQERIAQAKENVLELPDKVDEVERIQEQMNNLGKESREALVRANRQVNDYLSAISTSREMMRQKLERGRSVIGDQKAKLGELEKVNSSAEETISELRRSIDRTEAQIEELNSGMRQMLLDLEEAVDMKNEVSDISGVINEELANREEDLESMEADLDDIGKIEQWALEYLNDYENKISSIEDYVTKSEEDLASVREAAEAAYMRRYLRELDDMTDAYDSELTSTIESEEDLDLRIKESKKRLSGLVKESRNVLKKLHKKDDDIPDFEEVSRKVRGKTAGMKKTIKEKANERQSLREEAGKKKKRKKNAAAKEGEDA
jgi:hypothetical protein